uniref:VCBS repeat-containing protein n=1 Tax=Roseihalotalea indica TaxID=2867963 RepID=A0AA49JGI4_9BACT|nr:VCBS repeat-containing protein [Tunicatimonas sp. TK19036]
MRLRGLIVYLLCWGLLTGCQPDAGEQASALSSKEDRPTLFRLLSASQTGLQFQNNLTPDFDRNILEFNYFYNGGGVALGDVNNDGATDIFFTGNMVSSALYLNQGELKFKDVTPQAGLTTERWATGAAMVDINQDSLLDIYVCFSGIGAEADRANQFFINQGVAEDGTPRFKDMARNYGLADTGYSTQAAFFDYDKDGDLDMYLLSAYHDKSNPNFPKPKLSDGTGPSTDRLYRNDGTGPDGHPVFTDVSDEAGIVYEGYGLGIAIGDVNQDGWDDIYVANDFIYDDLLYINNGDATFSEKATDYLKHTSRFSMGCDMADINNDNLADIMVLDMLPEENHRQKMMSTAMSYDKFQAELRRGYQRQYTRNMLQLNNGNGPEDTPSFSEIGYLAGVYRTDWSWSPLLADVDNDGFKDIFVSNGIPKDITNNDYIAYRDSQIKPNASYDALKTDFLKQIEELPNTEHSNYLFQNKGANYSGIMFSDKTHEWGLDVRTCSNGAAFGDLDQDGDLDLVINNLNKPAFLYENTLSDSSKNHYLRIQFDGPPSVADGIGSKIFLRYGGQSQYAQQSLSRGFQSSAEPILHFGLGDVQVIDTLEVVWPDGQQQLLTNVDADQLITLDYSEASPVEQSKSPLPTLVFQEVSEEKNIRFTHEENAFDEFKIEFLLPHMYSQNGPGMAVGDVNGDQLDDFIVGGASGKSTQLFTQNRQGAFSQQDLPTNSNYEDMGVLLFDKDNDGDLDLYMVSGGNEFNANSPPYQDRLFVNDGQGNFTLDKNALPELQVSGSCVVAADYDQDGDLDLFVGGRIETGKYPLPVNSFILRNDDGNFTEVTQEVCPDLQKLGLVTSALWTDFNNDGQVDLLVAGEWMPLTFFVNQNGKFTNITQDTGLSANVGWWNSLTAGDYDNDGDTDYIAGNLGLNAPFKASADEPVTVYAKDFDYNGSTDAILTKYTQGKSYPVAGRNELISQMIIYTRKKFPNYIDYADATITDLFSEEDLQNAYVAKADNFQTSWIENLGNGHFALHPLPIGAQFAPVYGTLSADFDNDGNVDVLLTGNSYAANYMTGRYDASTGLYLKGHGDGTFTPMPSSHSGFLVDGNAKALAELLTSQGHSLVVSASNSGPLKAFSDSEHSKEGIRIGPMDAYAEITLKNGKTRREEFHYGSSYLSQSSRVLWLGEEVEHYRIYDYSGNIRSNPSRGFRVNVQEAIGRRRSY